MIYFKKKNKTNLVMSKMRNKKGRSERGPCTRPLPLEQKWEGDKPPRLLREVRQFDQDKGSAHGEGLHEAELEVSRRWKFVDGIKRPGLSLGAGRSQERALYWGKVVLILITHTDTHALRQRV